MKDATFGVRLLSLGTAWPRRIHVVARVTTSPPSVAGDCSAAWLAHICVSPWLHSRVGHLRAPVKRAAVGTPALGSGGETQGWVAGSCAGRVFQVGATGLLPVGSPVLRPHFGFCFPPGFTQTCLLQRAPSPGTLVAPPALAASPLPLTARPAWSCGDQVTGYVAGPGTCGCSSRCNDH